MLLARLSLSKLCCVKRHQPQPFLQENNDDLSKILAFVKYSLYKTGAVVYTLYTCSLSALLGQGNTKAFDKDLITKV